MPDDAASAADDAGTEAGSEVKAVNSLSMSDADFENMGDSFLADLPATEDAGDEGTEGADADAVAAAAQEAADAKAKEGEDDPDKNKGDDEDEDGDKDKNKGDDGADADLDEDEEDPDKIAAAEKAAIEKAAADKEKAANKDKDKDKGKGDEDANTDTGDDANVIDFEAEHAKILAPFRANGKDMKVDSVDDAIRLMQMGANYNRKMAAMRPGLTALKMLEKNDLLDPEKITFLIDLDKKNPEAIAKLLKDGKIDPLTLNLDDSKDYKASDQTVADKELELDTVLADLKDSETYNQTIEIVTSKWDEASKQTVANAPQLLRVINDHIASGVYDLISTRVESERMFGRLNGVSDIEAYRTIGDAMQAKGEFDNLSSDESGTNSTEKQQAAEAAKAKSDEKRKAKRKAASSAKRAASNSGAQDLNPLALSDDDFMKQHDPALL